MNNTCLVLVIEDEQQLAKLVLESLKNSRKYKYQVEIATTLQDCIDKGIDKKKYDIVVVDLKLSPGQHKRYFGLKIISILASTFPEAVIVVYSGFGDRTNVIESIRRGATTFIPKGDKDVDLVGSIESILNEKRKSIRRKVHLDILLTKKWKTWEKKYAGKVVALVGDTVVAFGRSRLEASVAYDKLLDKHPRWPKDPDMIEIQSGRI